MRLLKVYHKFREHFKYEPKKFKGILMSYFNQKDIDNFEINYSDLYRRKIETNLKEMFNRNYRKFVIKMRGVQKSFIRRYVFRSWNIKDYYFLKYIGKTCRATNEKLFPICKCGKEKITGHAVDHCIEVMSKQVRRKYKTHLGELYRKLNRFRKKSLHEYILDGLFELKSSNKEAIGQVIIKPKLNQIIFFRIFIVIQK